jgi:hypothetical protein
MPLSLNTASLARLMGAAAIALPTLASAGCPDLSPTPGASTPAMPQPTAPALHSGFVRTALQQVDEHEGGRTAIVGLWRVTLLARGNPPPGPPDGAVLDKGFATWHADGTELMNSGRPPASSSFCMGVWKQTGPASYQLNHWALSWSTDGTAFVGPTNIREQVTVHHRDTYTGTFNIDQYDAAGTTVLGHVQGVVMGERITAD